MTEPPAPAGSERDAGRASASTRTVWLVPSLCIALVCSIVATLSVGAASVAIADIVATLRAGPRGGLPFTMIIWGLRLPRIVLVAMVGAALGLAGSVTQAYFRNPLAEPGVLGVSAGAALGGAVSIALGIGVSSLVTVPIAACIGAAAALLILMLLARDGTATTLLLAGVALSSLLGASLSLVLASVVGQRDESARIMMWLLGSFEGKTWAHVLAATPGLALGLLVAMLMRRDLEALVLGEVVAESMGVALSRLRTAVMICVTVLVGTATASAGAIAFVGLVAPHVVRLLGGQNMRQLIPAAALMGACLLVWVDALGRWSTSVALPPGAITSLLGAPMFLFLLRRHARAQATGRET